MCQDFCVGNNLQLNFFPEYLTKLKLCSAVANELIDDPKPAQTVKIHARKVKGSFGTGVTEIRGN